MIELTIKDLTLKHENRVLIESFSATFNQGDIVALVGDNGSGKTTLLHVLAGLKSSHENILLNGQDIASLTSYERARQLTLLLQSLPPHPYSLAYNRIAQGLMPHLGFRLKACKESEFHVAKIAKKLNIEHLLNRAIAKMSGGEQRLVNIAKCFVNEQIKIIILDEPSVFLDIKQRQILAENISERAFKGCLIIFSSHDSDLIKRCATKILPIGTAPVALIEHPRRRTLSGDFMRADRE